MRRRSASALRAVPVAALAALCLGFAPLAANAQDTSEPEPETAIEAAPDNGTGGFAPPLLGSPDRLIGAGSRELGPGAGGEEDPCAVEGDAPSEGSDEVALSEECAAAAAEEGESTESSAATRSLQ